MQRGKKKEIDLVQVPISGFATVNRAGSVFGIQLTVQGVADFRKKRGPKPKEEPEKYPNG